MKNKTFWIGIAVTFVVMQVYSFLVHGLWLGETYEGLADIFRSQAEMESMMGWMWVSSAIGLVIFGIIFVQGREGKGVMEGVRYGALIGTFYSVPMAIDQYVVWPMPLDLAVIWLFSGIVGFMIAGAVFATLYKPGA
ncbi:MAG: hypothetical protein OEW35_17775 [Gammaproteobacteria bacterium]|nr:hypothetical protein [Gammaproteobacteria bacterium]MDH4255489.1 hypothetical protein [Gammaproteobacteria bacterium]MDH5311144.1 hypothetical protein [Gammaproteobacteria bacterium]